MSDPQSSSIGETPSRLQPAFRVLRHPADRRRVQAQRASNSATGPLVLLIEDDPSMRALFEIHLNAVGYRVLIAQDGEEALRVIQGRSDIRLTVMDVVMSGLSGRHLAEKLQGALPNAIILFCSGYSLDDLAGKGILTDDAHFLQKPYRAAELKHKIERLLAKV